MACILLTGFEPFGDWKTNPSWDALVYARDHGLFDGLEIALARVPVVYATAFGALDLAVEQHKPETAISFGLHGGMGGRDARTIYVETTARNRDGASKADNSGVARAECAIDAAAPATLPSALDSTAIVRALKADGFAAAESADAGAYLCNHLFFRGASALRGRIPYGFVHVPPVQPMGGTLPLDRLARAAALIARVAAG